MQKLQPNLSGRATPDAIHERVCRFGYCVTNTGRCSDESLLHLCDQLGRPYERQQPLMAIEQRANPRYVGETNAAIPPHNECAYGKTPPRYLALFCAENSALNGEFFLVSTLGLMSSFDSDIIESMRQTVFLFDMNLGFRQPLTLLRNVGGQEHLIYSAIGNNRSGSENDYYRILREHDTHSRHLIRLLNEKLLLAKFRRDHQWEAGDLIVFDNLRFMHGRNAFHSGRRRLVHFRIAE